MKRMATYACDGCSQAVFELHATDGAKLCGSCVEKTARIDRRLATTLSEDPVYCDWCDDRVDFDARVAVVTRECGGKVICDECKRPMTKLVSA